jgi:hypothetical protein
MNSDNQNAKEAVVKKQDNQFTPVDLNNASALPDLETDGSEFPIDLMGEYWTPVDKGENKRMFFDRIQDRVVKDEQTGESLLLPCAFFVEKKAGELKMVANGSKRLVGLMENLNIQRGTPLSITYLGKKKNNTNSFLSDQWSVKPIILNIG